MRVEIDDVVYFYMFVCVSLLVFNLLYITRFTRITRRRQDRERRWKQELAEAASGEAWDPKRRGRLFRRLRSTEELMAFQKALSEAGDAYPRAVNRIFEEERRPLCSLALEYGKKEPMERAFFAYMIAAYSPPAEAEGDALAEILLGYLEGSTVYCRENVLSALYALGSRQAVVHAFDLLNEHGWYHYPRLLSDGLIRFTGDKTALARQLWQNRQGWAEFLVVATVQFAAALSEDTFAASFLEALAHEALPLEARFALIRYFQRHPYEPAKPVLLKLLEDQAGDEGRLAIVAVSALAAYPGDDTRRALKHELQNRNWYVRHNAALSLNRLGVTRSEVEEIKRGGDRYAIEMLRYVVQYEEEDEKAVISA